VPATPAAFLDDLARSQILQKLAAMPLIERAILVLVWPPAIVLTALWLTAANGPRISRRFHRSIAGQFIEQMRLAFTDGVLPTNFYFYELHEPQNREKAREYVQRVQLKRGGDIYKRLYIADRQRNRRANILNDKIAFSNFCRDRGLPSPRLFAIVDHGVLTGIDGGDLPQADLFVKPSKENGGDGTERWTYANGLYRMRGRSLMRHQLTRHLIERSRRTRLLVQECLANHHELRCLSAGALNTLRCYTFLNERGDAEHIFSMLRMSRDPRRIVDNVCRGGLAAKVDPETGTLGPATDSGLLARTGWLDRHPFTGANISGRRIPFWPEALRLVIMAHRELAAPFMIGWDIAITETRPVIVEGNKAPDIDIEQRLSGPWGNERFGELLAHHIKAGQAQEQSSRCTVNS